MPQHYLNKNIIQNRPKENIDGLINQMATQQLEQPIFYNQPLEQMPPLQGQVQPSDRDLLRNTALDLIMQQMQPVQTPSPPITAEEAFGGFQQGIGTGLRGILEYAGTPAGKELIGVALGAGGGVSPFVGHELEQQAAQERLQLEEATKVAQEAQKQQREAARDIYKDITKQELEEEKLEFEREKYDISKVIKKADDIAAKAKTTFDAEQKLRKEFTDNSKDFIKIKDAYNRVEASAEDPSAAGDLALIFNYMKILDPGSVVREGEFATAQNSAGVPERIRAQYNRIKRGERLTEVTRTDFLDKARALYNAQAITQEQSINEFRRLAAQYNLNPENIIGTAPLQKLPEKKEKPIYQEGQTATNPNTGERLIFRGGKWQKI